MAKTVCFARLPRELCLPYRFSKTRYPWPFSTTGHSSPVIALLVPRQHYETLGDLPPKLVGPFFSNVQLLARAVEVALDAEGTFVAMNNKVSQSVPHLHVHVVPRRRKDGLKGFFWPRTKYKSEEEMLIVQEAIRLAITSLN